MTRIYGQSDDTIEFEGDVDGEVSCYGIDNNDRGVLLSCSDGTLLEVKYGKTDQAVWEVKLLKSGNLFVRIESCTDEDSDPHSDVAIFNTGLKWIYAAKEWERVR